MLVADPSDLTSLNSRAYFLLVERRGPSEPNCVPLSIRNGLTSFSHANGSLTNAGSTGRHWPAPVPTGNRYAPKRPSSVRAAIIAAAAAPPTAIPRVFALPSGIAASDAAYCASSVGFCAGTRLSSTL